MSTSNTHQLSTVAEKLRGLRERNGWTVAEMSEKTGIPKPSLQNYMRIESAQKPGLDAILALSEGLSVSIDWLVSSSSEMSHMDTIEAAALTVSTDYFSAIAASSKASGARAVTDGKIFNQEPAEFAKSFTVDFLKKYYELETIGASRDTIRVAVEALKTSN